MAEGAISMDLRQNIKLILRSITNSYSQIFFSDNVVFAIILMLVSFFDVFAGLAGMISVVLTNIIAWWIGFDKHKIAQGYYGFNSFLVGTGLGLYFAPGPEFYGMLAFTAILTLLIAVSTEGVIGKYGLPNLSLPFVFSLWLVMVATRSFDSLGISERWIYSLNDIYAVGGKRLVEIYEWWNNINLAKSIKIYFYSLGAIVFQYNLLSGILIAAGLLIYSRIAFTLSLLGFFSAYLFYLVIGVPITETGYSYIGFNYILTAIALGGFFLIPSRKTYFWVVLIIPVVAILTISFSSLLGIFQLPAYALPFNIVVLMFLYALKFRSKTKGSMQVVIVQQNKPERNLYSYLNHQMRFQSAAAIDIQLPFHGEWVVTQAYDGKITHKKDWKHALDFEIVNENELSYRAKGDFVEDYYCYGKSVLAVADGIVEEIQDGIPDNIIGESNVEQNWGNTIVIRHGDYIYSKLSHLKSGSFEVEKGQRVTQGQVLAKAGSSGRSPIPHLHFQMQATPFIGSKTISYPISSYIKTNGEFRLKCFTVPEKTDRVQNIKPGDALRKTFNLVPGKTIKLSENNHGGQTIHEWETFMDLYGKTYLYDRETDSLAYYRYNDKMLVFEHFKGDRTSLLYNFYLAAYRVQNGFYKNLKIKDQYPLNTLFLNSPLLFIQDFIAPFYIFLKTQFLLEYTNINEDFLDTEITIKSQSIALLGKRVMKKQDYEFRLDEKGLHEFIIQTKGKTRKLKCIED